MDITTFKGLNNVTDPLRAGMSWLQLANNVDITASGALVQRAGYLRTNTGSFTGLYSTMDYDRMYCVDGGSLKTLDTNGLRILKTGLNTAPMYWTEVNDQVFYNNGIDSGIVLPDNTVLDWVWVVPSAPNLGVVTGSLSAGTRRVFVTFTLPDGRMTGASEGISITTTEGQAVQINNIPQVAGFRTNVFISPGNSTVAQFALSTTSTSIVWNSGPDTLGYELQTEGLDPLPQGCDVIQHWRGRIHAAQYFAHENQTAIWASEPFAFHLFDLSRSFLLVPGRVTMLAPFGKDALLIGTDSRIYSYDGQNMTEEAPYGVPPGQHWSIDTTTKKTVFWSDRGVCEAMPFRNLTEGSVSVAPGVRAGGTVVMQGGQQRYLAALRRGGSAFNSRF